MTITVTELPDRTPMREIVPGMVLVGWRCMDCRSCDRRGVCHVCRMYTGLWSPRCGRFRLRNNKSQ